METLLTIYWILFCVGCGVIEGIFFHLADYNRLHKFNYTSDIHVYLNIFRLICTIPVFLCGFWDAIGLALMFSFLHDGFYYMTRKMFLGGIYEHGFFTDGSSTTTAVFSPVFKVRTLMFAVGVVIVIFL